MLSAKFESRKDKYVITDRQNYTFPTLIRKTSYKAYVKNALGQVAGETDVIDILEATPADVVRVYDLSGVLVKTGKADDVMKKLPRGIYIVNGKKVVTK